MTQDPSVTRTALPNAGLDATSDGMTPAGTIANRYDLIDCIGRGGMGRVFRAYDRSLKRQVAIKVLAPDLAASPTFSQHMMREARAVAQLQHPGIASVHDVVDEGGTLYLVMELLRGETLANRLRRRPLGLSQAVGYGCQVADALAHAHAHGIVHCDLKPGNIFVTKDDQVKVVDFGLARAVKAPGAGAPSEGIGASPTLIDGRGGTPRYMAPEQTHGLPLDHRADIYSFGVVLQEMFAGSPPASIAPILQRAQEPDAAARFQTVEDLKAALEQVPAGDTTAPWRRSALVAAALALLVFALLALLPRVRSSLPSNGSVPVLGVPRFATSSSDSSMSFLAAGLSDMVATDLGATNSVVAAPSAVVVRAPDEAARLARELGAGTLVLGAVERVDGRVSVAVRLFSAAASSFTNATVFNEPPEDLLGIQRALSTSVRGQLAAAGIQVRAFPPQESVLTKRLLPATMSSFEEYAQARRYLERTDIEADINHAMSILTRIITREPNFALARAALGEATWRKWQATKDPVWSDAAREHALEALRLSADLPEVRYSVALIYQGTGHPAEALAELEHVALTRPFNDDVQRSLGRLYADSGQLEKGLQSLNRAITLRPGYWGNHAALGLVAYRAGKFDQAITAFQKFCDLRPDSASAHQRLGTAYHAAGNLDAALASYERALEISPNANAYLNVGTLHFDARRYERAAKAYERAIELEPRNPSLSRNLADALQRLGDTRGAARAYGRVIVLATDALRVNPKDASILSLKAVALAHTGRLVEAESVSTMALTFAPADNDVLYEHGLVLTMRGRQDEAVSAFRKAVAAGYSATRLGSDPDLGSLATLPAFRQLLGQQR